MHSRTQTGSDQISGAFKLGGDPTPGGLCQGSTQPGPASSPASGSGVSGNWKAPGDYGNLLYRASLFMFDPY